MNLVKFINLIQNLSWIRQIQKVDHEISEKLSPLYFMKPISAIMNIISLSCSWTICFPLYFLILLITIYNNYEKQYFLIFYHLVTAEIIQLSIIIPLRYLVRRPRPIPDLPFTFLEKWKLYPFWKIYAFLEGWNRYSFPSLHASRAFLLCIIIYNGLAIYNMNGIIYLVILIFASITVSFSRLVLQRHFLSDVITGAMVGITSSFAALKYCFL
ncbi:MAG: phosphatase PAP2 family protein [Desulfamplus sp.]|nr:phosphatase PAP2 family protein [Desulfamplus sp.]